MSQKLCSLPIVSSSSFCRWNHQRPIEGRYRRRTISLFLFRFLFSQNKICERNNKGPYFSFERVQQKSGRHADDADQEENRRALPFSIAVAQNPNKQNKRKTAKMKTKDLVMITTTTTTTKNETKQNNEAGCKMDWEEPTKELTSSFTPHERRQI